MTRGLAVPGLLVCLAATFGAARAEDDAKSPEETKAKAELAAEAKERFAKADASGDGYLRGAEIPQGWLDRYDLDGDGRISRTEFVEISTRPPKLRHPCPMRDAVARAKDALAKFDKNKDGAVGQDEYPGGENVFRSADRNRDGALDQDELSAMAEDQIADIRKRMRHPSRYDFLVLFDIDHDNKVSSDEYDGPMAEFRKFDTDGDGVVTYDELYPEKMMERMKKEEMEKPHPEDLDVVKTMDKNGDGKVTREEFKGNEDAWKRLDRNGDGVVTFADAH